jgi:hypothetical protein
MVRGICDESCGGGVGAAGDGRHTDGRALAPTHRLISCVRLGLK